MTHIIRILYEIRVYPYILMQYKLIYLNDVVVIKITIFYSFIFLLDNDKMEFLIDLLNSLR